MPLCPPGEFRSRDTSYVDVREPGSNPVGPFRQHRVERRRGDACLDGLRFFRNRVEQAHGEGQEVPYGVCQPVGAVGCSQQHVDQAVGMADVEPFFTGCMGSSVLQRFEIRVLDEGPPEFLCGVVEPVAHEGVCPAGAGHLHDLCRSVVVGGPVKRQLVDSTVIGWATLSVVGDDGVEEGRMAELVLGDAGECHVLFEERCDADPLGVLLSHEVLVVGEGQQELGCARGYGVHVLSLWLLRWAATRSPSLSLCGLSELGATKSLSPIRRCARSTIQRRSPSARRR